MVLIYLLITMGILGIVWSVIGNINKYRDCYGYIEVKHGVFGKWEDLEQHIERDTDILTSYDIMEKGW